jgi:GNAT superfamily N-acetyltransferase
MSTMDKVVSLVDDMASPELLSALHANMVAFWTPYGRSAGCTLHATPSAVWFYTGVQHPLFNGVISATLGPDEVEITRDALQAHIKKCGAPALWWVGPRSKPDDLGTRLERLGLQPAGEAPGMAIDLASLPNDLSAISGFVVERIEGPVRQAQWARIAAVGTEASGAAVDALERIEATLADPQYRAQHRYVGMLDGLPVATSALVFGYGVAGIYAVATLPAARNKGIGRAMTLSPLLEARRLGYRVGILQASSMGYPIYKKMGFGDVCTYWLYMQS